MKGYVLVMGQFNTRLGIDSTVDLRPILLGVIDPTNIRNTISITDIFTNKRISEVLYNLGIRFDVNSYAIYHGGTNQSSDYKKRMHYFGPVPVFREQINTDAFSIAKVETDVWDMDPVTEELYTEFKRALSNVCDDFDDTDFKYVIDKLALDTNLFIYQQYQVSTEGKAPESEYYMFEGNIIGEPVSNMHTLHSKGRSLKDSNPRMNYPIDAIPFTVPSFYDLMTHNKYEKMMSKNITDMQDSGDVITNDMLDEETSLFSNTDISYEDLYKPFASVTASTMTMMNGTPVPLINPQSINVQSVTPFWDVYPASNIIEKGFGTKPSGEKYHMSDLTGHPELNHLPLQENEKEYYDSLVNLLTVALCIEYNALSDEVYRDIADVKYSKTVEEYCKTLAEEAFNTMWCHTGTTQQIFPNYFDDSDNDDEVFETTYRLPCRYGDVVDTSGINCQFESKFDYIAKKAHNGDELNQIISTELRTNLPRLNEGFDGNSEPDFKHYSGALVGYVEENTSNKRWIDALIRLLRWGERKPSMLTHEPLTGEGNSSTNDKYWNLNTTSISSHDGNMESRNPIINPETGNEFNLIGVVSADITIPKGTYQNCYGVPDFEVPGGVISVHVPVGVIFEVRMEGTNFYKTIYEDIFTYHNKLQKGYSRGNIAYKDGSYVDVTGYTGMEIAEVPLQTITASLDKGTLSNIEERINPDTGETMRDEVIIKVQVSACAEIELMRGEIMKKFIDPKLATAYKEQSESKNIFNSLDIFIKMPSKENFLRLGKNFNDTLIYPGTSLAGINPENARIVYDVLNHYCGLNYTPKTVGATNTCDLEMILHKLDEVTEVKSAEETDVCWTKFLEIIDRKPDSYIFCKLKLDDKILPVGFGLSKDKSDSTFIVVSSEEIDYLKQRYNITPKSIAYAAKYKKYFDRALKLWNSLGKTLKESRVPATFKDTETVIVYSSNKVMPLVIKTFA